MVHIVKQERSLVKEVKLSVEEINWSVMFTEDQEKQAQKLSNILDTVQSGMLETAVIDILIKDLVDMPSKLQKTAEKKLGSKMMTWSAGGLMVPDPIPFVDEILFGIVFTAGAGLYAHGALSAETAAASPSSKVPLKMSSSPIRSTNTNGTLSRGGKVKQQISSTSRRYSRRNNYYYKRKRYYRN